LKAQAAFKSKEVLERHPMELPHLVPLSTYANQLNVSTDPYAEINNAFGSFNTMKNTSKGRDWT
jgi:hypothetical protein